MSTIIEYVKPLLEGEDLSFEQATELLDIIFEGEVPEAQIAAFLTAMRIKGPTAAELAGLAKSLRSHAVAVKVDIDNLVDTCGTGGGAIKTSNISTAAAIVAAGAGVYVAKHGNRGITSKCGSADVLEELGFRTVFNILGPLANPANAQRQILGVADEGLLQLVAEAFKLLGTRFAMVVHSNGMDEISTVTTTKILELKEGQITSKELNPEELGIGLADIEDLRVTDAKTSAKVLRDILGGKESGPRKDIVVLNAAAAIIVGGLADDFASAIKPAEASVSDGKASACLEKLIEVSNRE